MTTTPSAPQPGTTLAGKYLVERVLGIGGMGVVVAAKHLQLDQHVAIKYLLPEALLNPEVVARFAREARAAAKIRGEHVARVIDVGQFDDGAPFMVLEYLQGHDLAKHLELHGPLPVEDAMRFLLETCEALAEAHVATIVHRDLKPSNLFLAEQPDKSAIIKVLDFGISKTGDAPSASLTKTSALMGTAFYMSPEQLTTPKGVDHRSDIWSLGVILYELLTGRQPFLGESVPEIVGAILTNQPEGLRTLRADVPAGLEAVVVKCIQTKAADRYQSVAALAAALAPFAALKDRVSVDITARVLGEVVKPESLPHSVKSTVVMPSAATITGSVVPSAQPSSAGSVVAAPPSGSTGASVGALTAQGLSTSAITPKPKRGSAVWLAAVAAVVVVGGAAVGITMSKSKGEGPPVAATGIVAAPPTDTTPAATTAAPTTPTSTAAALTPLEPSASASAVVAVAPGVGTPRATPSTRIAPTTATAAAATAAAAKSATPAVATAPPPASAAPPVASAQPAPAASKNPLQMGIK